MDSYQFFIIDVDEWHMRLSRNAEPGCDRLTLIGPEEPKLPIVPMSGCEFASLMEKLETRGYEVIVTTEKQSLESRPWKTVEGQKAASRNA